MQTIDVKGAHLSPQQLSLWHLAQDKSWYGVQCAIEITGDFKPGVFQHVLQNVIDNHDILHTTFVSVPGIAQPMQAINEQSKVSCPLIDLQHLSSKAQQAFQDEHWHEFIQHSFDLEHGPLLYAEVLRLSSTSHLLLLNVHALCADASTLKPLSTAIFQSYTAYVQQNEEAEPDEPLQYVNVTAWLKELLQDEEAEEQRIYWRKLDLTRLDTMPLPFQRSEKNSYQNWNSSAPVLQRPHKLTIPLSEEIQRHIHSLAQRFDVSTEVILLAIWQLLLWKLTGDQDLLMGISGDGRPYEDLTDLIGPYARMVPLTINLTNERSFAWVLIHMQQFYQQALEKQLYFTWEALNSTSQEQRSFPLSFAYESWPQPTAYGPLTITWQRQECYLEPFQLQLYAQQSKLSLQLQLAYNTSLFSEQQIQRMAGLFLQLLSGAIVQPEEPIGSLPLLTDQEQVRQQERWHGQQCDWPFIPLHERFHAHAQQQPAAPALRFGTVLLSYQELEQIVNQLAHLLLSHNIGSGQRVALYQRRDQWAIICMLAVLKVGGCYVPLDEDLPPSRVQLLLEQLAPAMLICNQELQEQIGALPDSQLPAIKVESLPILLEGQPTSAPEVTILPQQAASIIYTSGSTGSPKGVQISQQSISNYTQFLCEALEMQADWHYATVSSLAADLGNTSIFAALASGGCLHLLPYTLVTDGAAFASYVKRYPLDVLKIVPTHLQALLSVGAGKILPRQRLILGGEALPWTLIEQIQHSLDIPINCQLYNHYGPTETTIGALINPLGVLQQIHIPGPQDRAYSVPIGHPITNVRIAIWDVEQHAVPQGCKGELYIAGAGVSLGYLGAPDLTAERFLTLQQTVWYRTGDIVRENEEGLIEFIGRHDAQVKLRGYRIELGEIEEHLRNLPMVREAVVQLRSDGPDGQQTGDPYLVGYIVPWKQPGPDQHTVWEALSQLLPSYLIPKHIVSLKQLPLSPNGKLDRHRLPVPVSENVEQVQIEVVEDTRTPIEAMVQQIWRQVLDIRQIGRNDDFFRLGGHSLLGTRIIAQMRTAFDIDVPITWLFEAPTVAGLSQRVEEALRQGHGVTLPPLVPGVRDQKIPLSFAQQRLWFLDQLEPESTSYIIPRVIHLHGPLDPSALQHALHRVIARHENLRTTFPSLHGEPWQQIHPHPLTPLILLDLRVLPENRRSQHAQALIRQEVTRPFDLTQGPLLRSWLLQMGQDEHILLLTLHHIISDGWSSGLLIDEITTLYLAHQRGETASLPSLPIQYADFALWQRSWLQGALLEQHLSYWKTRLAGLEALRLPTTSPRPTTPSFQGARQHLLLPASLRDQLQDFSQREGVTLFMTLLTAFQILLARSSGQRDIAVGTPIANRTHQDLESLIGFFVNMLVLRSDLSPSSSARDLLREVRSTTLDAYAHQDIPFEQVVEAMPSQRDGTRSPLFQVTFVLQNAPDATSVAEPSALRVQEEEDTHDVYTAKFELTMIISESPQGLHTTLEYMTELFSEPFITRFLAHWQHLLHAIVADPDQNIFTLPLLPTEHLKPMQLDWHLLPPARLAHYEQILGQRLESTLLTVLDEAQRPVPLDIVGQLYLLSRDDDRSDAVPLNSGDRVRVRADGTLDYLDHPVHPRQILTDGASLSLDELEEQIRQQLQLLHCRLIAHQMPGGGQELVAYLVTNGGRNSTEDWQQQLRPRFPEAQIPRSFLIVSHLPLTPSGEIDDQALLAMAPLTPQTLAQWEHYLRQQDGVDQVAVVIQEPDTSLLPLHLADLLADWDTHIELTRPQDEQLNTEDPSRSSEVLVTKQTDLLSVVNGRDLLLDPTITNLPQMLLRAANPDNNAHLIYLQPDGREVRSSYQQLLHEAQQVLAGLHQLGLQPRDKVIIQVEWCQEFLPVLWGCLLGGIVAVPIAIAPTYAQPTSASARLFHAWQLLEHPIVVAGSNIAPSLRTLADTEGWTDFSIIAYPTLQVSAPASIPCDVSQPDDLALILLTSGSTGAPKGVMQSHRSLLSQIQGQIQQLGCLAHKGATFNWMPLDHVGGVVMLHFHALFLQQSQIHTLPQYILQDPLRWLDAIERYQATTTWAPNFAFGLLNERAEEIAQRHWNLSSLHYIINAGEAIVASVATTFMHLLHPFGLPGTAMRPVWGMSETCSGVTFTIFAPKPDSTSQLVEVGEPIPGFSVRLVDADDQLVPQGRIGRLQVRGPSVTRGYYHNEQATSDAFTADGWFDTGDLGLLQGGQLTITGRAKDTIIINGINYYSQEIETAVEALEEVETSYTAACAIRMGENATDQLAIFVVSRLDSSQDLKVIKQVRAQVSARVGITPTYVLPVSKQDIPKTGIGKIQRPQLKQAFETGLYRERLKQLDRLLGNANTLPNWFSRITWQNIPALVPTVQPTTGYILVLATTAATATRLGRSLQQQGQRVLLLSHGSSFTQQSSQQYQLDLNEGADYALLTTALPFSPRAITHIVHCWEAPTTVQENGLADPYTAIAQQVEQLQLLIHWLAQDERSQEEPLTLLSVSTQGNNETTLIQTPVTSVLKTLARELPWFHGIHLTIAANDPDLGIQQIVQELLHNHNEPEITYRHGQRFATRLSPIDWPANAPIGSLPLLSQGCYLLSGGAGGLGYELACHLLKEYQGHLLLLGRSSLSHTEHSGETTDRPQTPTERLNHLQGLANRYGGSVRYASVDVCDLNGIQQVLNEAQQVWQRPLDGIFHLAGEFHEQVMLQETAVQIEQSLRPKVLGAWTLHQLLKDRPGALFVNYASINAFFGGGAVGAYAAANGFLEAFTHYQRAHCGLQSYCLSWSIWDEIGMSQGYQLTAFSQAQGYQTIAPQQGWYSLLAVLQHDLPAVLIGLDIHNPHIRPLLTGPSAALEEAVAYIAPTFPSGIAAWPAWWGTQPENYRMITRTTLPLTESGEIDVVSLGGQSQSSGLRIHQEPRSPQEQQIREIWRQVLKDPQIGILDNFFELGGHSLLATQVIARMQRALQIEIPVRYLFEYPTIADLAQFLEQQQPQQASPPPPLLPASRDQKIPLSFAQQRLWFLDQLEPESTSYIIPRVIHLHGPLDPSALQHALHRVIARHENLRTTFPSLHGEPWQQIHPHPLTPLILLDLRVLPETRRSQHAQALIREEVTRPFDLTQGPLLRSWLLQMGPDEHILLLTLHHIISDGWSSGLLIDEITTLYLAHQRGETASLPSLPIQYADFALWQRSWLQGALLEQHLSYWKTRLAGLEPLRLPTTSPRPTTPSFQGARQHLLLPASLRDHLQDFSQREGVTLFMTLLTAFQILLARSSGQRDIAVGTPIANRTHQDLESLIGFFVNMLVLRSDLSPSSSARDLLREVRSTTLDAYAHQDIPFEQVVEAMPSQRDGTRSPLFQVTFVLQNAPDTTSAAEPSALRVQEEEDTHDVYTAKFELTMIISESPQGLHTTLEYMTELFSEPFITRFLAHWQHLLHAIVADPDQNIFTLPLLPTEHLKPMQLDWHLLPPARLAHYEQILGQRLESTLLTVLDEAQRPVPLDIVGQLYLLSRDDDRSDAVPLNSGDRVRVRADGTLDYLDHPVHPRQILTDGAPVSLDELEEQIRQQLQLLHCRLIAHQMPGGGQELVAYLVTDSGRRSTEDWQQQLRLRFPEAQIPRSFLIVSHLPLTSSGEIDDQALLAMAPLTPQTLAQWEHYVRQQSGVEQVAVLRQEYAATSLPLHLDDLLPNWNALARQSQIQARNDNVSTSVKVSEQSEEVLAGSLSLISGPPQQLDLTVTNLPQMLLRAANPDNNAHLIYLQPDGREVRSSYQQLLHEAQQVLAGLHQLGLQPHDKVIIQVEWCQEFLPVLWGCLLGGIVAIPTAIAPTYAQPTSASARLFHAWQLLEHPIVVAGSNIAPSLRTLADTEGWTDFSIIAYPTLQASAPASIPCDVSQPDDLALILLTSGSTGAPKGVMQSHRSLLSQIQGQIQQLGCPAREGAAFNWMPLDHVGGVVMLHFHALFLQQSQIHTLPQYILQEPLRWLDIVERYQITATWAPNFAFGLLNERAEEIAQRHWNLSSLHYIINGGEAIVASVATTFMRLLHPFGLPSTAMRPAWGMSETCSGVAFTIFAPKPDSTSQLIEVGEPIPDFSVRLVDADDQLVPQGRIGRLQVRGPSVTRGYYHNEQATHDAFTADGWFDTGDLGLLQGGQLTITGRAKDTIIINGINYYSQEIETAVEALEEVETSYTAACAVRVGESATDQLAIFVVSRLDPSQDLEVIKQVRAQVSARMGITPTYVLPVSKQDIPKTGIGKIQRPQLKQAFETGLYRERLKQLDRLLGNANTLPEWFYRPIWQQYGLPQHSFHPHMGKVLILTTTEGSARMLYTLLQQQSEQVVLVTHSSHFAQMSGERYQLDLTQASDYDQLAAALAQSPTPITHVVQLWEASSHGQDAPTEALLHTITSRIQSLRWLIQMLAREERREENPLSLLTISIQGNEEAIMEQAPISGFLKTLARELPWFHGIHLSISAPDLVTQAQVLLQELTHNHNEPEVAYRHGQRFVTRLEPIAWASQPTQALPLQQNGCYLLSGGMGGVGFEIASHLLQEYQAHLLLLGRTVIDPNAEEIEEYSNPQTLAGRLAYLQMLATRHGGSVRYTTADVCDLIDVQQAVHEAQTAWQHLLDGIFHLAGEFHEQVVLQETDNHIEQSLRPKIAGAWTLHQLLKDRPGTLFVSSSSVNAFFGGHAVGAYAAANGFLEAFTHYQRDHCGIQSYCLAWSMWDEVGMSRGYQLKALSQAQGYQTIAPQQGWYSLLAVLYHDLPSVLIGLNGHNIHIRPMIAGPSSALEEAVAYVAPTFPAETAAWPTWWGNQPENYRMITRSTLPLTKSGEIDAVSLGGLNQSAGLQIRQEPRSPLELQIREIWGQVLKQPQIGILDNFFEMGGHSLLATQVIARMQRALQIEIPLRYLFEYPTIADLAQTLEQQQLQQASTPPLQVAVRGQKIPLSFAQQRLWFLNQLEPDSSFYNMPAALRLQGPLSVDALQRSWREIIQRHEVLRTTFGIADHDAVQRILPGWEEEEIFSLLDLSHWTAKAREQEIQRWNQQEARQIFDLTKGPLVRMRILKLASESHLLLVTMHHIISDGWSLGIFIEELTTLYNAFVQDKPVVLPPLPIQYADFAIWQNAWLRGDLLEKELMYWKEQLAGMPQVIELPLDHSRPTVQSYQGAKQSISLPAPLTQSMRELSQQEEVTLFMALLTSFLVLLWRYSGQEDIVVGTPIANRNRIELEGLIGFFANTLVLRTSLTGDPTFREVLKRVREVTLAAYNHQDVPFEKLVEVLQPERRTSHAPLIQVMFASPPSVSTQHELTGLTIHSEPTGSETSNFDLICYAVDDGPELEGQFTYSKDLFEEETIQHLLSHWLIVLEHMVSNLDQQIGSFPLVTKDELEQFLSPWKEIENDDE